MKRQEKNDRYSCSKRKRKSKFPYTDDNDVQSVADSECNLDTVFPLLLAALSNLHMQYSLSIIKKCLKKFRISLKQNMLDNRIVSLLPVILKSEHARIVSLGAEIVGAASLLSSEMNEQIALDGETVKALLSVLASPRRRVSLSACNAVLDLCTTSIGRQCLLHSSALHALMWEGFIHTALFYWSQNQEQPHYTSECSSSILYEISVSFLHIAIQLMGSCDLTFRKACLAAANLPSCSNKLFDTNLRIFFSLIDKINAEANFLEVIKHLKDAIEKHEDPFERMKWLLHLNLETIEGCGWHIPYLGAESLLGSCLGDRDATEASFMHIKYRFCVEVSFEDVTKRYRMLLDKYRRVREQYMNGMVSLHCGSSS